MNPEARARQEIDAQLAASGWAIQDYRACNFTASRGIALCEVPLTTGPCDYLLLVDRQSLDSHAEDIVHICRGVFGPGNDFCRKITSQSD